MKYKNEIFVNVACDEKAEMVSVTIDFAHANDSTAKNLDKQLETKNEN